MKKLIINADDLGYDADTLAVTADLMRFGSVTSATILLGFPETDNAIKLAKELSETHSFGLHFNIAEGVPMATKAVPSLINKTGHFNSAIKQRLKAVLGALNSDDIANEDHAQLAYLSDHGVQPTHIDSHGHFHKFPAVLNAMLPILQKFGVKRARAPQSMYDNARFYNSALDSHCLRNFPTSIQKTDAFFNTRLHDENWFARFLSNIKEPTTELGVHPGSTESWRHQEAAPLRNSEFRDYISKFGVELINFHYLHWHL